jgi:hypothetical protein
MIKVNDILIYQYCNVLDQRVAKQRLGKQPQQQRDCFLWVHVATVTMQRRGKYASTTVEAVFSMEVRVEAT